VSDTRLPPLDAADQAKLAEWRSWLEKDFIPEGWDRNLWDEFYALFHRRAMWRDYRDVEDASPDEAREAARFLTRWVLRNHIETQAMAIRRIANRTADSRPISLVKLLDEIAATPQILGIDPSEARGDADALHESAKRVSAFANKVVAHFDRDYAAASRDTSLKDMDDVVDLVGRMWEKWYVKVTDKGASAMEPVGMPAWSNVLRLRRRDPSVFNPTGIGWQISEKLDDNAAHEVLDALSGSDSSRRAITGKLWASEDTRWLAEALADPQIDPAGVRQIVETLRILLGQRDRDGDKG
jgi:hypothetical protein